MTNFLKDAASLLEDYELYQAVSETVGLVFDPRTWLVTQATEKAHEILGWSALKGVPLNDLVPLFRREGHQELAEGFMRQQKENDTAPTRMMSEREVPACSEDGSPRRVRITLLTGQVEDSLHAIAMIMAAQNAGTHG